MFKIKNKKFLASILSIIGLIIIAGLIKPVIISVDEKNWDEILKNEITEIEGSLNKYFENESDELTSQSNLLKVPGLASSPMYSLIHLSLC